MSPETLREFRVNLLLQARAANRQGLNKAQFALGARTAGFGKVDEAAVTEELQYLIDKGQVTPVDQEISPEVESFRITATGKDWLAQQNY